MNTLKRKLQDAISEVEFLSVINGFAKDLLKVNSSDEIAWTIIRNAISKLHFTDCVVYLLNADEQILVQVAAHGSKNPEGEKIYGQIAIPIGKGIVGNVALTGQSEIIPDTSLDARYIEDDARRLSEIAVPIVYNGEVIGVIDSEHPDKDFYTYYHLQVLETIASMSSARFENSIIQEELLKHKNKLEEMVNIRTKELNQAIDQLKSLNKNLQNYAYAASHDLAEPLLTISSFSKLIIEKEDQLSAQTKEYLQFIIDGVDRMNKMLYGLLEYSQLDPSDKDLKEVCLQGIIEQVKKNLNHQISSSGARIEYADLPCILGYPAALLRLFQNLISNAIKFRQADTEPIITISAETHDDVHKILVADNGIGIDKLFVPKAFDLFTKLHVNSDTSGIGMGLSICKRVMELHKGSIGVSSGGKNRGSMITLKFPRIDA